MQKVVVKYPQTSGKRGLVYDGYLCIQRLNTAADNAIDLIFAWDPAERVATRPLMIEKPNVCMLHVTHDGNKNVSDLVFFKNGSGVAAHYEYAPFGALTASTCNLTSNAYDYRTYNPFRFSSEYADDVLGLVYYNFRHYSPSLGRWMQRDPGGEDVSKALYVFVGNDPVGRRDFLGMDDCWTEANAVAGISFSINVGLGELTGSFGGNRSTVRCNKDCSKCKKGYTIETTTSWGGGTGGSWKWVTPIGIPIDVGFSWELDKSQWYFYDSCINREDSKSCATISVSIFAGKCFGIGPWIRHCFNIDGTYVYSDCGNGHNNFSIGVTWTQCYGPERFGGCISTRYSPDWLKFGKY